MDPVKGKPDQIITPTSQTNQGGGIFFASEKKLPTGYGQGTSEPANLTFKELETYLQTKLSLQKVLESQLPDPSLFRRILARVIIELQFNLEDPRLQQYVIKLIQQNLIPTFLLNNPDKLEHLVRFLGTLVSLELENLDREELFHKFLLFITGAEHTERTPLYESFLSLIKYKGRIDRKSYWWEYDFIEFSDGKQGLLQYLYGPEKKNPYKIVVTLPIERSEQDQSNYQVLSTDSYHQQSQHCHLKGYQETMSYWWLEPERSTLFEHGLVLARETIKMDEFHKQLISNLKVYDFERIHPSVQFPIKSAETRSEGFNEIDLGLEKGLDLFG
jgi:hypothetical protein